MEAMFLERNMGWSQMNSKILNSWFQVVQQLLSREIPQKLSGNFGIESGEGSAAESDFDRISGNLQRIANKKEKHTLVNDSQEIVKESKKNIQKKKDYIFV